MAKVDNFYINGTITGETLRAKDLVSKAVLATDADGVLIEGSETDPLSLHLDQTTSQTIINGTPVFDVGIETNAIKIPTNAEAGHILLSDADGNGTWQLPPVFGQLSYYITDTASDVASNKKATSDPLGSETYVEATSVGDGDTLIQQWITEPNIPMLSFIPAGNYVSHLHLEKTGGTKDLQFYVEFWETDEDGVEIGLIATAGLTDIITEKREAETLFYLSDVYTLSATTSRIKIKVYAEVSGGGSAVNLRIYYGDGSDSHFSLPSNAVVATNFVPYTGAVYDVDLGAKDLTTTGDLTGNTITGGTLTDGSASLSTGYLFSLLGIYDSFSVLSIDTENRTLKGTDGTQLMSWASTSTVTIPLLDIGTTVAVGGVLDDDSMATATDSTLATSESIKAYVDSVAGGYTNLTSFVDQTAWRLFYSNTDGDVTELAFGTDGQVLTSTGASSAPAFETPTAYLANIVEDTTPQLGGDLDCKEYELDNVGDITHDDSTASDWNLINQDSDKDILVKINDGGTTRTAVQIHGDNGAVSFPRQSYVLVVKSGNQNVSHSTEAQVTLETETADRLGEWASSTFTAKHDGIYAVMVYVAYTASVGSNFLYIKKNGSLYGKYDSTTTPAADKGHTYVNYVALSATDTIKIYVVHYSGATRTLNASYCWASITKVS